MENVAHSRRNPKKPSVTLSSNDDSFSGKSLYDDVYGGPPKFGISSLSPRFEDYVEIFGSFQTTRVSSIPVLDLPAVHEAEALFDTRNNRFNYTEVFGALDFAETYDNLLHQPNCLDEEAWTSAEADAFSSESSHSGNNQSLSTGDLFGSVNGNTEFNLSYHKVNVMGNEHMLKGRSHMTHLHAVPGFSQVYDETLQSCWNNPSYQVPDVDTDFSRDKVKGNHPRKAMRFLHSVSSDLNLQNGCSRNDSDSSETFITVSDISLRSMPSQVTPSGPPLVQDAKKGDIKEFHSNGGLIASKEKPGESLPLFFDVEVDMNSSGAPADAMKEAMLRTKEKHRSAKKFKEKKKGVCENRVKSSHEFNENETKMIMDMTRFSGLNDDTMRESCDTSHTKKKISASDERQKPTKGSPETPNTLEGKRTLNTFEEFHMKESMSSQDSGKRTGVGRLKDECEFFELKGTEESRTVIRPTKPTEILVQDTRKQELGQKEKRTSNIQEKDKKVNATEANYQGRGENEEKNKAVKETYEPNENIMRFEGSDENWRQREHAKKEKVAKKFEQEENEKNVRMVFHHGRTEKKVTEADQSGSLEDVFETGHEAHTNMNIQNPKEIGWQTPDEVQLGTRLEKNEKKPKEVEKQHQSVKKHKQSAEIKENGKTQGEAFAPRQAEFEVKRNDTVELEDVYGRPKKDFNHDDTREKEACRIENDLRLKQTMNKKGKKEANEGVDIEKGLPRSFTKQENDEGLKDAFGWDENKNQVKEDFDLDVNKQRVKEAFLQMEKKERENEVYERKQNRKNFEQVCDRYGEGNISKEAAENKGIQKVLNQASEKEWNNGVSNEAQRKKEIGSTTMQTFGREGGIMISNENSHLEKYETLDKDLGRMEKDKGLDKALDETDRNEEGGNMKFAKATYGRWETESNENHFAAHSASIHEENIKVALETVFAEQENGMTRTKCTVGEKKLEDIRVENQLANEKIRADGVTLGAAGHSPAQSGRVDDTVTKAGDKGCREAVKPGTEQEVVNVQKSAHWFHVSQSTERKVEIFDETPATVVKDDNRARREVELENDCMRKVIEERDREKKREKDRVAVDKAKLEERERIKDRMAMDRATLEAHDKAYADAYERVERVAFERASVEAQQRALAEAMERLEKASAEARDKSYIDKATAEARLKVECASVERATGEAQERAVEKLEAQRAEFESREQLERSESDNFGDMLDPECQNSSSTGSRYPYLLFGAASFSERSEREGESARRCRARLERHRRIAERAAKALAEKNMRDLLAQEEQAERRRLSETLDAEIRRWSRGKEGNLRALLSTLQYILGQDSGWQPIPLVEVITSAAVKKAYRKATLCVHPDKLQQRGAGIQQKYTCEKVFDLLKDAWNKFNSEEW